MDCVSCESCKVHSKLQMVGLATALRLLVVEPEELPALLPLVLRNEWIAFFHTILKFAESVAYAKDFAS